MTDETHCDRAVRAAHAYYAPAAIGDGSGFEAFLREYETRTGLAANTLPNPIAYVRTASPFDTRTPLFRIFDLSIMPDARAGQRNRITTTDLSISIAYTSDTDVEAAEDIMRAYLACMIRSVEDPAGRTFGRRVVQVAWTLGARANGQLRDTSQIRHVRSLDLRVDSHDP